MALLDVRDLTVDLEGPRGLVRVLDGISFSLDVGESQGIVGESGCGKSITALAVLGLLPEGAQVGGSIHLDGTDITGVGDRSMTRLRGRQAAMVFQEPMTALNPVRTIGDQVAEGPRWHLGLNRREAMEQASALLGRVGLPAERFPLDLYPHQLSGGQRQRVVIAMALACGPRLLIADEPTTALDVTIQAQILDLIAEVTDEEGMALLLITHDLGVIAEMTDRMLVMYAGCIVERGTTPDVFARMAHPYTRGLFEAMPAHIETPANGHHPRLKTIPGQVPEPQAMRFGCPFAPRCYKAEPRCRANQPPAIAISPGHDALCFYPEDAP